MAQYGYRNTSKEELANLFPMPSETVVSRGTQIGIIIKFKTFYLKIYDDTYEDAYIIKGYRYNENAEVFEEIVHPINMPNFAKQFSKEDFLRGYKSKKHCD